MFSSIRTSIKNKNVVTDLTRKIGLGPENTVARLAFAYSLAKGRMYSSERILLIM
jgi:DNA sulfur modification protein DndE